MLSSLGVYAPALCNLGVVLVRAGKVQEAAECYNLALATPPATAC